EQHSSEHAARWHSAVRSKIAVARLSRAAARSVAGATECMEGPAPRLEGRLWGRLRTARSFDGGPADPHRHRHHRPPGDDRPYRSQRLLDLVCALVAGVADWGRTGSAGRMGPGHAPAD